MTTTHLVLYTKACVLEHLRVTGDDVAPDVLWLIVLQENANWQNALLACADPPRLDHEPPPMKRESPNSRDETKCKEVLFGFTYIMVEASTLSGENGVTKASGEMPPTLPCTWADDEDGGGKTYTLSDDEDGGEKPHTLSEDDKGGWNHPIDSFPPCSSPGHAHSASPLLSPLPSPQQQSAPSFPVTFFSSHCLRPKHV